MKRKLITASLLIVIVLSLSGCGPFLKGSNRLSESAQAYAGTYLAFCAKLSDAYVLENFGEEGDETLPIGDQYVFMDNIEKSKLILNPNGTGIFSLGDGQSQSIEKWNISSDGAIINIVTRSDSYVGEIDGEKLELTMKDGFAVCFFKEGADTSAVKPITINEYFDLLFGVNAEQTEEMFGELDPDDSPLGSYEIRAMEMEGYTMSPDALAISGGMTLREGGTGTFKMNAVQRKITDWGMVGNHMVITVSDGSIFMGTYGNGIALLDITGNGEYYAMFARDDADLSNLELLSLEEVQDRIKGEGQSLLYAQLSVVSGKPDAHLKYKMYTDYQNSVQEIETFRRNSKVYMKQTTKSDGGDKENIVFYDDGAVFELSPETKTGNLVTKRATTSLLTSPMSIDPLYLNMHLYINNIPDEITEEEIQGTEYDVYLFEETEKRPVIRFYFLKNGKLSRVVEGAPAEDPTFEFGKAVYIIEAIDNEVDEEVFDISAYDIAGLAEEAKEEKSSAK